MAQSISCLHRKEQLHARQTIWPELTTWRQAKSGEAAVPTCPVGPVALSARWNWSPLDAP
eukprot:10588833-Alexandrium_andersonii.AAC.1